jgi:pimeloyl-[acyl-carrier protein] synthase
MTQQLVKLTNPINNTDQDFLNDPYPTLKRLREEAPVWYCKETKYWVASRYAEIHAILRDLSYEKQIFRWKHNPSPFLMNLIPHVKSLRNASSNWMLNLNPPDHTRVRSLVNKAFTPKVIQELRPQIQTIADELIILAEAKGSIDLMADYAFPLPIAVIGFMLGIPMTDREHLKHWSDHLVGLVGGMRDVFSLMRAGKAIEELADYLRPLIEARRKQPKDDLMSVLVQAEEEGTKLNTDELVSNCILLLVAGHETTVNLIGNAALNLFRHPDQLRLLQERPELITPVIDEVLRFESPVQTAPRLTSKDVVLGGQAIKAGEMIWMLLGSSNRDPEQFENPDRFDISRGKCKHLAFSEGIHRCVGASLAETEGQIAIETLFRRLPNLKLDTNRVDFKTPFGLRGPKALPVSW